MNNNLSGSKISRPTRMSMRHNINFDNSKETSDNLEENTVPSSLNLPIRKENMSRMSNSLNPDFM